MTRLFFGGRRAAAAERRTHQRQAEEVFVELASLLQVIAAVRSVVQPLDIGGHPNRLYLKLPAVSNGWLLTGDDTQATGTWQLQRPRARCVETRVRHRGRRAGVS